MSTPQAQDPEERSPESDSIWDEWCAARRLEPGLQPGQFLARHGPVTKSALDQLELLLALERQAPPSPLVDAITLDLGTSEVRFAGFRLLETLGQGSSGIVYLARDERSPADATTIHGSQPAHVALKVLNPLLAASPERRDTILHEAEVARSLDHEGIVRVLASGVERGYAWIATEHVEGETLDRLLGKQESQLEREALALDVGSQLARALEHAHARGVVHRDLKPANLILSEGGLLKVLDFGLARTQGTAFSMSRTGEMVGTPLYMAPEQARGVGEIGPWTDIHAVGLVLWEIASGRKLDEDEPLHALLARIARGRYRVRSRDLRGIKPGLASVIRRCLEPHPADRYQHCAELLGDLSEVRVGRKPRMGAMSTGRRWGRACGRHPARTAAWILGIALFSWGSYWLCWNFPVRVELKTINDGKQIWFDGVQQETGTARAWLWPGKHQWKAQLAGDALAYQGEFEVRPHEQLHMLKFLNPWHGPFRGLDLSTSMEIGKFAWVLVATPTEKISIVIDGVDRGEVPGITQFALRLGKHTIEARAAGLKTWTSGEIDLKTQDLCFLPFEMEPEGSEWETILLYSPFDYFVKQHIVEEHGLRLYGESDSLDERLRYFVWKFYWGPDRDDEEGTALIEVPLPDGAEDLQVEFSMGPLAIGESAWSRVSLGTTRERLSTILEMYPAMGRQPGASTRGVGESLEFYSPPDSDLATVRAEIPRAQQLYLRFSVGGVKAGSDLAYAFALRSNAQPDRRADGELLWSPALKIRVKSHQ